MFQPHGRTAVRELRKAEVRAAKKTRSIARNVWGLKISKKNVTPTSSSLPFFSGIIALLLGTFGWPLGILAWRAANIFWEEQTDREHLSRKDTIFGVIGKYAAVMSVIIGAIFWGILGYGWLTVALPFFP